MLGLSERNCPIRERAQNIPTTLAIKSDVESLTYQDLDQRITSISKQLHVKGLNAGDRLACIAENSINLIILQLSCIRSGVIFCPINPRFNPDNIQLRLNILKNPFIWTENENIGANITFNFSAAEKIKEPLAPLLINPEQVSNIIFTSGSSGVPKAVMHSFNNHFYSAKGSQKGIPLAVSDKNHLSLPIFHISGYATVFRTLTVGATLVLSKHSLTVKLLKEKRITHLSLVATQLYRLLENDSFSQDNLTIKHLLLGGSAFPNQLLTQTAQRGFTYHLSYGLTEMSSQVATSCNSQSLSILKDREVNIVDDEIFLRGKTRFLGYFKSGEAKDIIAKDKWFASKDLGIKVANNLQVIGRKDRQFICLGENIHPEEIESCLINFPTVKQAYVVTVKDNEFGDSPVAFIDWQDKEVDTYSLDKYIRGKLASFKCPRHYFLLPTQVGLKVSLADLKKLAHTNLNISN